MYCCTQCRESLLYTIYVKVTFRGDESWAFAVQVVQGESSQEVKHTAYEGAIIQQAAHHRSHWTYPQSIQGHGQRICLYRPEKSLCLVI